MNIATSWLVKDLAMTTRERVIPLRHFSGRMSGSHSGMRCDVTVRTARRIWLIDSRFHADYDILETSLGLLFRGQPLAAWHWSRGWESFADLLVPLGHSCAIRLRGGEIVEILGASSVRRHRAGFEVRSIDSDLVAGAVFSPNMRPVGIRERVKGEKRLLFRVYSGAYPRWQLWPLPSSAVAGISITDHADFDTVDGLHSLSTDRSLLQKVRITKSIFAVNALGSSPAALNVPATADAIQRLADHGVEIAWHSSRPTGASRLGLLADLLGDARLSVRTWIDHGPVSRTNLCRNAFNEASADYVADVMRDAGIRNVWSYMDRASNPSGLLAPSELTTRRSHLRNRITQSIGTAGFRRRAFLIADGLAGPDWTGARTRLPALKRAVTRKPVSASGEPDAHYRYSDWGVPPDLTVLASGSPFAPLFHPRPVLRKWSPWSFSSIRVNDLDACLQPDAIETFVRLGGAEVLHTYLLSSHPMAGWSGDWMTSGARRGLLRLAELGSNLWMGPVDDWAQHLRLQGELRFAPDDTGELVPTNVEATRSTLIAIGRGDERPIVQQIRCR